MKCEVCGTLNWKDLESCEHCGYIFKKEEYLAMEKYHRLKTTHYIHKSAEILLSVGILFSCLYWIGGYLLEYEFNVYLFLDGLAILCACGSGSLILYIVYLICYRLDKLIDKDRNRD